MSNWLPSLNALRAFEAVSRHLNYRKAAEELKVSPAAANQLVSKLEEAIGAPLLEKKGRGLVLTPIGAGGPGGAGSPISANQRYRGPAAHDEQFRPFDRVCNSVLLSLVARPQTGELQEEAHSGKLHEPGVVSVLSR